MSDVLILNTEDDVIKQEKIDPLPLYGDDFHMLDDEIPEYVDVIPNPQMTKLVQRLKMTMKKFGGLGLSANQCGVYERVFILGYDDNMFACINPRVIEQSDEIPTSEKVINLKYPVKIAIPARYSKTIISIPLPSFSISSSSSGKGSKPGSCPEFGESTSTSFGLTFKKVNIVSWQSDLAK
jgi:hypothetical protein